ncbi:MAG: hypothetical protein KJO75_22810 [Dactylosporangium sp.]|nr:hypothetical protein [Dactylosporangium sp.]
MRPTAGPRLRGRRRGASFQAVEPPRKTTSNSSQGIGRFSMPSWNTRAAGYPMARMRSSIGRDLARAALASATTSGAVANAHRSTRSAYRWSHRRYAWSPGYLPV